jgi:hypothetical protein
MFVYLISYQKIYCFGIIKNGWVEHLKKKSRAKRGRQKKPYNSFDHTLEEVLMIISQLP